MGLTRKESRKKTLPVTNENLAIVSINQDKNGDTISESPKKSTSRGASIDSWFNTAAPSHVGTGLVSGAGNLVKGVLLGGAALVAAPIVGAINEGTTGFVKGVGLGVAAAVSLPVAGVITGVQQVGSGCANTSAAIKEYGKGKVYNPKTQTWELKYHPLDENFERAKANYQNYLAKTSQEQNKTEVKKTSRGEKTKVVDTEYYDTLGVSVDATQSEIRKRYYKLAMKYHPDKVINEQDRAEAQKKFQEIGEVYQILAEPTRRSQYDKYGKSASDQMNFIDTSLFFTMLFGSEKMEPFVGKLTLDHLLDHEFAENKGSRIEEIDPCVQEYREALLAITLRENLADAVHAMIEGDQYNYGIWRQKWSVEVEKLCELSFGALMVDAVGFSYQNYAEQFIGNSETFLKYGGTVAKIQHQRKQISRYFDAIVSASKASKTSKKMMQKQDNVDDSANMTAEDAENMEAGLKHLVNIILQLCLADINNAVRNAAKKYLNDTSIDASEQKYRAKVLKMFGNIFLAASDKWKAKNHIVDVVGNLQEAFFKMNQKKDEEENRETESQSRI